MPYTVLPRDPSIPHRRYSPLAIGGVCIAGLLIILGVGYYLYYANRLPFWRRSTATHMTGSSYTKGQPKDIPSSQSTDKPTNSPSGSSTGSTSSAAPPLTGELVAPWGTFANIYTAKLDDQMQSTCNTTPGATCQITFMNSGIIKSLSSETADAGGAVYWSWKPQDIGLTPGIWHISAKASTGSQSKTTSNDPLTLEVRS